MERLHRSARVLLVVAMIDLHSHVLSGIDDGPGTVEGSLEIVRRAVSEGITTLVATPHVSSRYENDFDTIARGYDELSRRLREQSIDIELRKGAEIQISHIAEMDAAKLGELSLGGGPWLLVEPPFATIATGLEATVQRLQRVGHRVLIAHPERCPAFMREPEIVKNLVAGGALTSLTAGSLSGKFGRQVRRFALELLDAGLAHNVASDAHDPVNRPPAIAGELDAGGLSSLSDWLTEEVPAAILGGGEVPPRPRAAGSSGARRWRLGRRQR
jgi:protein-tyrosine phosphatase